MFFIDDDERELGSGVNTAERVPMTIRAWPLCAARQASRRSAVGEARVHRDHAGAEAAPEALDQLRRQGDFRHEHQRLAAARDGRGDDAQVDLGLAAAGHAVQQVHAEAGERRECCRPPEPGAPVSARAPGSICISCDTDAPDRSGSGASSSRADPAASSSTHGRLEGSPTSSAVGAARSASQASSARCCGARRVLGGRVLRGPAR